jgi:hypothetical protein
MRAGCKIVFTLAAAFSAAGCIQMHPTRSGFLADYSQLVPIDKKERLRVKPVDPAALENVDSFYIAPVEWLAADLGQPASSEKHEESIRNSLRSALERELGALRPIVSEIGPNTAIVRAAVTGVQESKPLENLLLMSQILGPFFNGGAVAEIEVLGPQGTQIAAESVAYKGRDWELVGFFWRSKHAEAAMKRAAQQLSEDIKKSE